MTNEDFMNHTLDDAHNLDRKSLDSKTKFTATTMSSNESFSEKKRLDSLHHNNRGRGMIDNSSHSNKNQGSFGSGYESPSSKDSESVQKLISSLRRTKYGARAKSEPRSARTPSRSKFSQRYNVGTSRTRTQRDTPSRSRNIGSPAPRRSHPSSNDYDYRNGELSASRHRDKLMDLIAREEKEFAEENHRSRRRDNNHNNNKHRGNNNNMERNRSRSKGRLRELIAREEEMSSALLRNNLRDMIEGEMGRHDDYKYGKYNRRERGGDNHARESRSDRRAKEKMLTLTSKNEDLKKCNMKLRQEIDDMKIRMGEVIEYSMFFQSNENGEKLSSSTDGFKNMAKAFSKIQIDNKNMVSEIDELKGTIKELRDVIRGHEESIESFQDHEEDQVLELQEKNEFILALEKDKETLRQYLLESQIENKIIKKKALLMEQKLDHLEASTGINSKRNDYRNDPSNKKGLYVHPPPPDETTVSSLED